MIMQVFFLFSHVLNGGSPQKNTWEQIDTASHRHMFYVVVEALIDADTLINKQHPAQSIIIFKSIFKIIIYMKSVTYVIRQPNTKQYANISLVPRRDPFRSFQKHTYCNNILL